MNVKTIVTIGSLVLGSYLTGKIVGAHDGAKAVLDEYKEVIPEKELTVRLLKVGGFKMSVVAKKGES